MDNIDLGDDLVQNLFFQVVKRVWIALFVLIFACISLGDAHIAYSSKTVVKSSTENELKEMDLELAGLFQKINSYYDLAIKNNLLDLSEEINNKIRDFEKKNDELHKIPGDMNLSGNKTEEKVNSLTQLQLKYKINKMDDYESLVKELRDYILGIEPLFVNSKKTTLATLTTTEPVDQYEPNGDFNSAKQLYYPHSMSGYILSTNDTDYFKFVSYWGTGTITFSLSVPVDVDLDLFFMNANGTIIADSRNAKGINEEITVSVNLNETYYIRINSYSGGSSSPYTLSSKNMIANSIPSIVSGQPVDLNLSVGNAQTYKYVPGTTGIHTFNTGRYAKTGGASDTVLELYADSNLSTRIATNDDANNSSFSEIRTQLTQGTSYYIKVRPYSTSGTVYCRLTANFSYQTDNEPHLNLDPIDLWFDAGSAVYSFTPQNGGVYNFHTGYMGNDVSSGVSDTVLAIYSDSKLSTPLISNNDFNSTVFSSFDVHLNAGVKYYLKLNGNLGYAVKARLETTRKSLDFFQMQSGTTYNLTSTSNAYLYFQFTSDKEGLYQFYSGNVQQSVSSITIFEDKEMTRQIRTGSTAVLMSMTANQTYYIRISPLGNTTSFTLTAEPIVKRVNVYDNSNRLIRIEASPTSLVIATFKYDKNGNLQSVVWSK